MFYLVPPTTIIIQIHKRRTDNTILNYSCFQMENSNSFLFILWIKRHIKWFNAFSDKVYSVCLWENFFPCYVCYRYKRFRRYKLHNHVLQTTQRYIIFCRIEQINTKAFEMGFFSPLFLDIIVAILSFGPNCLKLQDIAFFFWYIFP